MCIRTGWGKGRSYEQPILGRGKLQDEISSAKGEIEMNLKAFMIIAAIVALLFGLGFILVPAASPQLYGTSTNITGMFLGRYPGASLTGLSAVLFLTRNSGRSETRNGMLTGIFITMVLGFVIALYDEFAGSGNALIWLNVAIYLLLAYRVWVFRVHEEG
jgi:hypothetical protein